MSSELEVDVVSWSVEGDVGIIRVNNPPVNALSQIVREGLVKALDALNEDPECKTILLHCDGRTFFAGADIREFNQPPLAPHLPDLVVKIYNSNKPVVAAMHGTTLGGGFEIAMACQYRTATSATKFGLPEVNLGLIPGAGGTQLLPSIVGAQKAIEMITSGKHYSVQQFNDSAAFDAIFDTDVVNSAEDLIKVNYSFIRHLVDTKQINLKINENAEAIDWPEIESATQRAAKGRMAPIKAVEVIKSTLQLNLKDGMKIEREAFVNLKSSQQSQALRHAFAAEKQAVKYQSDSKPMALRELAVIGGGTMGVGIATSLINAGFKVTLVEQNLAAAQTAETNVQNNLKAALKRGLLNDSTYKQRNKQFTATDDMQLLADSDCVIEAIFEDLSLKIELFKKLEAICKDGCIFATNTSYLDIDQMASGLVDSGRLLGLHFFSPAHIMKLVEVVTTKTVRDEVIATGFSLAKQCKKMPVLVGNCFGFAGNRMYTRYGREIQQLLLEGATVADIDQAMTEYGMAMGPLAVQDLAGIDVGQRARASQPFPDHDPGYFMASSMMAELGRLGRKTNIGFYRYQDGKAIIDPEVNTLIADRAQKLNITQTNPDKETIVERALMALISEGYQLFQEGIVSSVSDLDVIWLNGYGFPRYKGGPMFVAQQMGTERVKNTLKQLQVSYGEEIWPTIKI